MRHFIHMAVCALAFGLTARAAEPQWEALFDGKSLQGWSGYKESWRVQDGAIVGEIPEGQTLPQNQFIYCDSTELADFELSAEYRISGNPSANSGIQFRSLRANPQGTGPGDWQAKGYQADLDDGAVWLGRVYEEEGRGLIAERGNRVSIAPDGRRWVDPFPFATPASFKTVPKRADWNTYEVSARGPHIELRVNGVLFCVLDDHQSNAAKYTGKLAIQLHSGKGPSKIEFRNIRIKHLGRTELPPPLGGAQAAAAAQAPKLNVPSIKPLGAGGKALNLDFETGTLDGWKAEGDAWEGQPIKGDTVTPRKPSEHSNHAGDYWIGGYEKGGDQGTGKLTSGSFEVTHPYASFLVGGGKSAQTRVEIVADSGEVLHTASGTDSETMSRVAVDLRKWQGKTVFVRLVDESKIGWGHINFDDFVFHDAPPVALPAARVVPGNASRQTESPVLWHLRPNPLKPAADAPQPAKGSGAEVAANMQLTHGFQAELIAEEPALKQPIAFTFDERGRLWVAEAMCYPTKQPEGKGKDRILIFEDTAGNGTFDKRTVFIEGLNLVSALEVGFGGVWVGAAPQLLFIPDKNHDDVPDGPPEVLLDGFGHQDTHETLNSFIWGPDGWLYGNQGVFNAAWVGKPGTPRNERVEMHSAVWRYHPIRHEFEIFAHGGSNQWGLDFNSRGDLFMSHCRSFYGGGGTSYVIRNGHYWNQSDSNHAPFICNKAPAFAPYLKSYLPASAKYDDGAGGAGKPGTDAIYGGHAHAGTMIYQGDNWPEIYRDHLFTLNLFGAQMNHQENVREGSGYETMQGGYDILRSPDPTYLGVNLKYGPDGAVYIIDWCDLQHCHTPQDDKWDRSNGRIYRVSWAATYKPVKVDLGKMSDLELVQLQTHKNEWYARTARRVLMERASEKRLAVESVNFLANLINGNDELLALRAFWVLDITGNHDAAPNPAIFNASESLRAWAVQLAPVNVKFGVPPTGRLELAPPTSATTENSAKVRLALASRLPGLTDEERWLTAENLAMHAEDKDDRFLPKMIWFGIAPLVQKDLPRALALAAKTPLPSLADSIYWYAGRTPTGRDALAALLADAKTDDEQLLHHVRLLSFSLSEQATAALPKAWPEAAQRLSKHPNPEARALAEQLSALFGDKAVLAKMRETLSAEKTPPAERQRAFELLKRVGDSESAQAFTTLLDNDAYRSAVIPLLARSSDPATAAALIKRFPAFNEADRAAALNTLSGNPALAVPLLQAIEDKTFDKHFVSAYPIRLMLNLNNADVNQRIEKLWGKVTESPAELKVTIARFKKAYSEAPLWAYDAGAGKKVFDRTCATCHPLNGVGGKLGPDLAGSWRNGVDYFLENIVDPNAVVGENYRLNILKKTDGTVVSGMFDKETDSAVLIRTPTETISVPKTEIAKRVVSPQSVMPMGLLEAMPQREVLELLKFLNTKR